MGTVGTPSGTAEGGTEYVFWKGGDGRPGEAFQNVGGPWRGPLDLGIGAITQTFSGATAAPATCERRFTGMVPAGVERRP